MTDFEGLQTALFHIRRAERTLQNISFQLQQEPDVEYLQRAEIIRDVEARIDRAKTDLVAAWRRANDDPAQILEEIVEQECAVCGCTEDEPCPVPCHWIRADLCSSCIPIAGATFDQVFSAVAAVYEGVPDKDVLYVDADGNPHY